MSLWLAIGAGIALCGAALFEVVRPRRMARGSSVVLALALLCGAALAFSVAGLANRENKPAAPTPAPASYFGDGSGGGYFDQP